MSGLPLYGAGKDAEAGILAERGDTSIIASIRSHGTGRDGLQYYFKEQLFSNPPSDWEQCLGRLARVGQEADEVVTYVYRHRPEMTEALDKAVRLAKFVEGLSSNAQRLLHADVEFAY
jgi:hypothetical protein